MGCIINKLAGPEAAVVWKYDPPTHQITREKGKTNTVAKDIACSDNASQKLTFLDIFFFDWKT